MSHVISRSVLSDVKSLQLNNQIPRFRDFSPCGFEMTICVNDREFAFGEFNPD